MSRRAKAKTLPFDKYELYIRAVQSPELDVEFLTKTYRTLKNKTARVLREDFCGTGALCSAWVGAHPKNFAFGVDLDPEPLAYGEKRFLEKMKPAQRERVRLLRKNVLSRHLPKADISVGLNFSYFLFHSRQTMLGYFRNVHRHLKRDGIAVFDVFGGSQCQDAIEDRTKLPKFTYYWDQVDFDPVTHRADFHIHFRYKGKKYEKVFSYQWRMWSVPELRDLLREAGFKRTRVYWEGTTRDGGGNGKFVESEVGEACLSWICYIVAEK